MTEEARNTVESVRVRVPSKACGSRATACCSAKAELTMLSHANLKSCGSLARVMYFNHDRSWVDFSSEVISALKPAFFEKMPMVDVAVEGSRYVFDFLHMLQIDFDSGKRRSIAWIDENGKCFFPKVFVLEDFDDCMEGSENLKIEIDVRIGGNSIKRKRGKEVEKEEPEVSSYKKKEGEEGGEDGFKRPRLMSLPHVEKDNKPRWPNANVLREGEKGYSLISDYFLSAMTKIDPSVTITSVHECMRLGHLEAARFQVFRKQIEITRAVRGADNMVFAWHGTSAKGIESVLAHGFGVPRKICGAESYGVGVYLSPVGLPQLR